MAAISKRGRTLVEMGGFLTPFHVSAATSGHIAWIELTLNARSASLTLNARSASLTLRDRSEDLTLNARGTSLTLNARSTGLTLTTR